MFVLGVLLHIASGIAALDAMDFPFNRDFYAAMTWGGWWLLFVVIEVAFEFPIRLDREALGLDVLVYVHVRLSSQGRERWRSSSVRSATGPRYSTVAR